VPASNLLNYQGTVAALDAAVAGSSSSALIEVGEAASARLAAAGAALDASFNDNAAYTTWRDAALDGLEAADSVAAEVDGSPATTFGSEAVATYRAAIKARAIAASQLDHALAGTVVRAASIALAQATASVEYVSSGRRRIRPDPESKEAATMAAIETATALIALL
jgi:hypothetical protein